MPDKILIAEDESRLGEIVRDYFQSKGAYCRWVPDGEQALTALQSEDFDALLLDIMMPGADGYQVCRTARETSSVPILFLTALAGDEPALKGYELGADDYITKPFSLVQLYAKTMALIRRSRGQSAGEHLVCGSISLDPAARSCSVDGAPVELGARAFDLLLCLARAQGRVLSREQLLVKVWGWDFDGGERAVDVQVKNLRAALGPAAGQIKTVFRVGYRLCGKEELS